MTEDAKRKQRKRRQICLKFTDNHADWLIYQHIKKQQNIAAYIRRLVQRDMTDAEPVVRCKDCVNRGWEDECPLYESAYITGGDDEGSNFYCAWGERREDG